MLGVGEEAVALLCEADSDLGEARPVRRLDFDAQHLDFCLDYIRLHGASQACIGQGVLS